MSKQALRTKLVLPEATRPLLLAHRGVSSLAPENTLAAFRKAKELGIPGVELDVHLTKTGELVVIHDESIKRTGRIYDASMDEPTEAPDITVENSTWEELQQYDFGVWCAKEFAGEKLPLLSEVLDVLGSDMYVDIEIKVDTVRCKAVAKKTAEVLAEALLKNPENPHRFVASSFNPLAILQFKKFSNIPTALIYESSPKAPFFIRGGKGKLICSTDVLKPCWKDYTGKEKKEVWVWTVDSADDAKKLIAEGVKGICSNRPQDILPLLK